MTQQSINRTKRIVIPLFVVLLVVAVVETMITSNEWGLSNIILSKLLIPIILLSIIMSAYWILLTDDFWDLHERIDVDTWKIIRTSLKFLVWIPGMALYF